MARLSPETVGTAASQDTKHRTATSQEEVPTKLVKEVEEAVQHHLAEEKVQERVLERTKERRNAPNVA